MAERWVTVSTPGGLHARVASRLVRLARDVRARITIAYGERAADATSLTSMLALGVEAGSIVRVVAVGDDAEAALERVEGLLTKGGRQTYSGWGVSAGVGTGRGVLGIEAAGSAPPVDLRDRADEVRRLHAALDEARAQLAALEVWALQEIGGASDVLRAERELLTDEVWLALLERRIREEGLSAEAAVLASSDDPGLVPPESEGGPPDGLREVLRDVGHRLVRLLRRQAPAASDAGDGPVVLVARQVSPSELLEWPRDQLVGVATVLGSAQAHAALVARALRVPMVVGVGEGLLATLAGEGRTMPMVRVDGDRGLVVIEPDASAVATPRARAVEPAEVLPTTGREGPTVLANADTVDEARAALEEGASGIGLVRTERLYYGRQVPPDEEEQYRAFRAIAEACAGRPVAFRLADLGGDKAPPYLTPLLGRDSPRWRGAGLLARYPSVAEPHLHALARVARDVPQTAITIMVPMVATRAEWEAILARWRAVADSVGARARVSLMVETPAAALDVARLLPEADEVAIGTNDLMALVFGADRERAPVVAAPVLQPVVLRLVAEVVRRAHDHGAPVTVCGEAAGRLPEALVLWGLGVDGLSVGPGRVAALRRALGAVEEDEARRVAAEVMGMGGVTEVLRRLSRWRLDLAARGITEHDWLEGWEEHDIERNGIEFGAGRQENGGNHLGGGLA